MPPNKKKSAIIQLIQPSLVWKWYGLYANLFFYVNLKIAIDDMENDKSPGPDGYMVEFYSILVSPWSKFLKHGLEIHHPMPLITMDE